MCGFMLTNSFVVPPHYSLAYVGNKHSYSCVYSYLAMVLDGTIEKNDHLRYCLVAKASKSESGLYPPLTVLLFHQRAGTLVPCSMSSLLS